MIAEDGDGAICAIVCEHFVMNAAVGICELVELLLECNRRVVRAKNFSRQTHHDAAQMLIEICSLNSTALIMYYKDCKHIKNENSHQFDQTNRHLAAYSL